MNPNNIETVKRSNNIIVTIIISPTEAGVS